MTDDAGTLAALVLLGIAQRELHDAQQEIARLRELIDRDRTGLAQGLEDVRKNVRGWSWLVRGEWGSYDFTEQTEETLRREIGWCFDAIHKIVETSLEESGRRADSAFHPPPVYASNAAPMCPVCKHGRFEEAPCECPAPPAERERHAFNCATTEPHSLCHEHHVCMCGARRDDPAHMRSAR